MPHRKYHDEGQTGVLPGISLPAENAGREGLRPATARRMRHAIPADAPAQETQTEFLLSDAISNQSDRLVELHDRLKSLEAERTGIAADERSLKEQISQMNGVIRDIRESERLEDSWNASDADKEEARKLLSRAREIAEMPANASDADVSGALEEKAGRREGELKGIQRKLEDMDLEITRIRAEIQSASRRETELISRVTHSGSSGMAQAGTSAAAGRLVA